MRLRRSDLYRALLKTLLKLAALVGFTDEIAFNWVAAFLDGAIAFFAAIRCLIWASIFGWFVRDALLYCALRLRIRASMDVVFRRLDSASRGALSTLPALAKRPTAFLAAFSTRRTSRFLLYPSSFFFAIAIGY